MENRLSYKQLQAIDAIVSGRYASDREVAEFVGVHRVTITRWRLHDELFRSRLDERFDEALTFSTRSLMTLRSEATERVREGLVHDAQLALLAIKATDSLAERLSRAREEQAARELRAAAFRASAGSRKEQSPRPRLHEVDTVPPPANSAEAETMYPSDEAYLEEFERVESLPWLPYLNERVAPVADRLEIALDQPDEDLDLAAVVISVRFLVEGLTEVTRRCDGEGPFGTERAKPSAEIDRLVLEAQEIIQDDDRRITIEGADARNDESDDPYVPPPKSLCESIRAALGAMEFLTEALDPVHEESEDRMAVMMHRAILVLHQRLEEAQLLLPRDIAESELREAILTTSRVLLTVIDGIIKTFFVDWFPWLLPS